MAYDLRLSMVLTGLRYMELFLKEHEYHFGAWYNYITDVPEMLTANGWHVVPDVDDNWRVGSPDCTRLMYLAALRHIAKQGVWLQQFVFPILATVVQSPLRVFVPFNSLNNIQGLGWKHTLFNPAFWAQVRPPLHVAMTMGHGDMDPIFENAAGYMRLMNNRLPELNHFVTTSNDDADVANSRAIAKFNNLRRYWKREATAARRKLSNALDASVGDMTEVEREVFEVESKRDGYQAAYDRLLGDHLGQPLSSAEDAKRAELEATTLRVVILTDADLAMTAAVASCWPRTLHMYCLWHVFKNVLKNCSSSFNNDGDKTAMMRAFRNAAYAATPEVFATHRARLENLVAGKKCERYMADMIENSTKWAFCRRPTVLTLGMVSTQRVEGLFGVAKRSGVEKKLSLCALWGRLQKLMTMLSLETARLATPPIVSGVAFRDKHVEEFFEPIKRELLAYGASQYCQQEVRSQVDGSQAYDCERVTQGSKGENGDTLPLDEDCLEDIRSLTTKLNILDAPADTDLEGDPPAAGDATDNTMWARTSLPAFLKLLDGIPVDLVVTVRYKYTPNRPSHLVVFGPDNFHLCSCLQLLRRGLPCRHYFAVLVNLIGRSGGRDEIDFTHAFNGACIHNRWRRSGDDGDVPWSVSSVLSSSGHGDEWDGLHHEADDYWGPTCDDNSDGVHHSETAARARKDRSQADKRRVFACMMAKSKELVGDIMRSVPLHEALSVQDKVETYVRFILQPSEGSTDIKNPAKPPQKGRPKKKDVKAQPQGAGVKEEPRNPEGQQGTSRQTRRFGDFGGKGPQPKRTKRA